MMAVSTITLIKIDSGRIKRNTTLNISTHPSRTPSARHGAERKGKCRERDIRDGKVD